MKIITSHERADMDALASIYGASLLYTDHIAVLPKKLNRNVRKYLALYADAFRFVERDDLANGAIERVVLVDTHGIAPVRGMGPNTAIQIIDHHLGQEAPQHAVAVEVEHIGATSTLMCEKLSEAGLTPDPLGATLLLMGIYEDTGSLSYLTTTTRDAAAAAWLLDQGADLNTVGQFLHSPLTAEQRSALSQMISSAEMHTIKGRSICIATIQLDNYVDELSSLIHQVADVYEPDACFILSRFENDVQMIARSRTDAINVAQVLRQMGGGGHSKAAAALVRGADLQATVDTLLEILAEETQPPLRVMSIMSTNVHTVDLDMTAADAAQLMRRYGHEGFPVLEGGRLVGILTRSDIDRALHHRLGDMPVRSLLHTGPLCVHPQDPVEEVERVMLEHDLGQVPVVENGHFVGIVTRTDLIMLRARGNNHVQTYEVRHQMEEALPPNLHNLLIQARDVANSMGSSLYIVGGFVRDLLLETPTLDLDLVVEGDAIAMAQRLGEQLGVRVRSHARFGTAKVILSDDRPPDLPPTLDFVTARTEFYERPSELPHVERSSIKQDLYRRDFTINTMAICLDRTRYGELLDYYGGTRDLASRQIRVLHNLSFVEDPTRILRAARLEQRLGFKIEKRTEELIDDALGLLEHVSGERLRNELYLILEEREPERALERLKHLGVLAHITPAATFPSEMPRMFAHLRERLAAFSSDSDIPAESAGQSDMPPPSLRLCYLALLTSSTDDEALTEFTERLRITQQDTGFLKQVASLRDRLGELSATAMLPSHIYHLLSPFSREARFVLSVLTHSPLVEERLILYDRVLSRLELQVDGQTLKALGVPPGPIYGEILTRLHDALLDGQVTSAEEQQTLARILANGAHRRTQ